MLLVLEVNQNNMMSLIVTLQRSLSKHSKNDREHQFMLHSVRYLTTSSGRQVHIEDWMVTSFEVEFGAQIGSGGLLVMSLID